MSYLSVRKFTEYQHYKNRKPSWVKFYVKLLDPHHPINQLPITTRYLFDRLLLLAAEHDNAIPNDPELIAKWLRMPPRTCREGLAELLQGRWIKETKTRRRASRTASGSAPPEAEVEAEKESSSVGTSNVNVDGAADNNLEGLGRLNDERWFEVEKILLVTEGADSRSRQVVEACAHALPLNVLADIRERARGKSIGWAVSALKSEASDRQRGAA